MTEPGGEEPSFGRPFFEPVCLEVQQTTISYHSFRARFSGAVHRDLENLNPLEKTKAIAHGVGVAAAYAYQLVPAAAVGVGAFVEGYSHNGWPGAVYAGLFLGGVVGGQHLALGENAVEAAAAFPQTGIVVRGKLPRVAEKFGKYWEANSGPVSNGLAVSSIGVQSAIYNQAYNVTPNAPKSELRHFAHGAMARGTAATAGLGLLVGTIGKGLQKLGSQTNNHWVDAVNKGFDREVIDRPIRTAGVVLLFTVGNGIRKIINNRNE